MCPVRSVTYVSDRSQYFSWSPHQSFADLLVGIRVFGCNRASNLIALNSTQVALPRA